MRRELPGRDVVSPPIDAATRAWVVARARLLEVPVDLLPNQVDSAAIFRLVEQSPEFPAGPMRYAVGAEGRFHSVAPHRRAAAVCSGGVPFVEERIAIGVGASAAVALTRSGVFGGRPGRPGHVLLSDVEATMVDIMHLMGRLGDHLYYRGPCEVEVRVVWSGEGPLGLCAIDETTGELGPVKTADDFAPLRWEYRTPLSRAERREQLWAVAVAAADRFGVAQPQLVRSPDEGQWEEDRLWTVQEGELERLIGSE